MRGQLEALSAAGLSVVVVTFADWRSNAAFARTRGWPFPVLSDPERKLYELLGLGQVYGLSLWRPRVIIRYLWLMLRGYRAQRSGQDIHQLGGDVLISADRRVVSVYRSEDPTDRPSVAELLRVWRDAQLEPRGG